MNNGTVAIAIVQHQVVIIQGEARLTVAGSSFPDKQTISSCTVPHSPRSLVGRVHLHAVRRTPLSGVASSASTHHAIGLARHFPFSYPYLRHDRAPCTRLSRVPRTERNTPAQTREYVASLESQVALSVESPIVERLMLLTRCWFRVSLHAPCFIDIRHGYAYPHTSSTL